MKYTVQGALRADGREVEMVIDALTPEAATQSANERGILVASIQPQDPSFWERTAQQSRVRSCANTNGQWVFTVVSSDVADATANRRRKPSSPSRECGANASQAVASKCEPSFQRRAHFLTPVAALVIIPFFAFGSMWGPTLDSMLLPYCLSVAGSVSVGLVFLYALSPKTVDWPNAIRIGAFTAIVGIILLLLIQLIAAWVHSHPDWIGRGGSRLDSIALILYVIGHAYASIGSEGSLLAHLFGFTIGVGMCEELCKLLPIVFVCRPGAKALPGFRACMFLGAFSGLGFGVSEALHYSHNMYLPLSAPLSAYLLRFSGLPALHALWTALAAGVLRSNLSWLNAGSGAGTYAGKVALLCAAPAFLHGVYDAFAARGWLVLAAMLVAASVALALFVFRTLTSDEAPPSVDEQRAIFETHVRGNGVKQALGTLTLVTLIGGLFFYSGRVAPAEPTPGRGRNAAPPSQPYASGNARHEAFLTRMNEIFDRFCPSMNQEDRTMILTVAFTFRGNEIPYYEAERRMREVIARFATSRELADCALRALYEVYNLTPEIAEP